MKRTIKLSVVFLTMVLLSSSLFAQSGNGNGNKFGKGLKAVNPQLQWVDADGDGICDNYGTENQGSGLKGLNKMNGNGKGAGKKLGDGSGLRPQDGTGFGSGNGTGVCDGSGPKGGRK